MTEILITDYLVEGQSAVVYRAINGDVVLRVKYNSEDKINLTCKFKYYETCEFDPMRVVAEVENGERL